MSELSNAFSLLELDVEDGRQQTNTSAATYREKEKGMDEDGNNQMTEVLAEDYRLPLVWIDLEMTENSNGKLLVARELDMLLSMYYLRPNRKGLNIETERILEIACVITDGNLIRSVEGPDLVIHQTKECMDRMGEWCQNHHGESGLTERVLQSTITEKEAEKQVADFVKKYVHTYTPMLAGNSVYVDLMFLKKYMPDLASLFTHVLVDVSSIKALSLRWFPRDDRRAPRKEKKHRAMDDIKESIRELRYYKETIFKASNSRR